MNSYYLLPKVPNTGWIGIKEKSPLLLNQLARRKTIRKWVYVATKNIFWPTHIIYRGYGFYILGIHLISAFFIQKSAYFIYYIIAIIWSLSFINYSFSVGFSKKEENNKTIIFLWNLGLIMLLFVIGPIYFITHGYQWIYGIILFMNLIAAHLLWPLHLVSFLMLISIIIASLCCKPYNIDLSFWSI